MKINNFKRLNDYIVYAPDSFVEEAIELLKKSGFVDKVSVNKDTFESILEEANKYLKKLFSEYNPPQVEEEITKNGNTTRTKMPAFNIPPGRIDTALNKASNKLREKVLNAFPITKLHGRGLF